MIIQGYEVQLQKHGSHVNEEEWEEQELGEFLNLVEASPEERMKASQEALSINIHFMLSEETYDRAFEIVNDAASDPRLEHLNAIVFLAYKPKGRNAGEFTTIKSVEKMRKLIQHCKDLGVSYGCDSCSAPLILKSYQGTKEYDRVAPMIEPCEASCFSSYINADGEFFPCSFTEGEAGWETGLSVLHCNDFIKDIWNHERTLEFQSRLLGSTKGCQGCPSQPICRTCPTFDLKGC